MAPIPTRSAPSSRSSRVRNLGCWSSILIILWAVALQKVAVTNSIRLYPTFKASGGAVAIPRPEESVRAELIRTQEQTGLTLASDVTGLEIVLFGKRSLIRGAR